MLVHYHEMYSIYPEMARLYASSISRSSCILLTLFGVRVRNTLVDAGTAGAGAGRARFAGDDREEEAAPSASGASLASSSRSRLRVRRVPGFGVVVVLLEDPFGGTTPERVLRVPAVALLFAWLLTGVGAGRARPSSDW